jgi:hypothetical protein
MLNIKTFKVTVAKLMKMKDNCHYLAEAESKGTFITLFGRFYLAFFEQRFFPTGQKKLGKSHSYHKIFQLKLLGYLMKLV